jgi:hypothetical protein
MKYKILNQTSLIHGYTLKTKYRNLAISILPYCVQAFLTFRLNIVSEKQILQEL